MSDSFISIVDSSVSAEEALGVSQRILRFLVDEEIVESRLSDCILSESMGYSPGSGFLRATDILEDSRVINCNYDDFSRMKINGLEVCLDRCVVVDPTSDLNIARCPLCACDSSMDESWKQAMSEWHAGNGSGLLHCQYCKEATEVISWDHLNALAIGNLALTFWNWPQLSDKFIQTVSDSLGNPVRTVIGRI